VGLLLHYIVWNLWAYYVTVLFGLCGAYYVTVLFGLCGPITSLYCLESVGLLRHCILWALWGLLRHCIVWALWGLLLLTKNVQHKTELTNNDDSDKVANRIIFMINESRHNFKTVKSTM